MRRASLALFLPLSVLAACGGDGKSCTITTSGNVSTLTCPGGATSTVATGTGTAGTTGTSGSVTLVNVVAEPAGANCANGGKAIETGVDTNGNGVLDPSEVTSTTYVCSTTASTPDTVYGDVVVQNTNDIAALDGVKTITGDLSVYGANGLTAISLPTLEHVGSLYVDNQQDTSFSLHTGKGIPHPEGFPVANGTIASFSAAALTTIDTDLTVEDHTPTITTLDLSALKTARSIDIDGTMLTSVGFGSLKTINNSLTLSGTPITSLSSFATAFASFSEQQVSLADNAQLTDVTALASIASLSSFTYIDNAATALSFTALTTCSDIDIESNSALTSMSFPALTHVDHAQVSNNASVTSISFPVLASAQELAIDDNTALAKLAAPMLTNSYFDINGNSSLPQCVADALIAQVGDGNDSQGNGDADPGICL